MLVLLVLAACNNACQQICVEMANYAESDECGLNVTDEQVAECQKAQADLPEGRNEQCMEVADPDYIREWWTCDELAENFKDGSK